MRSIQYNFFSTPTDIIFKNQDYYLFMIAKNNKHYEKAPNIPIGSDTPLSKNDVSKNINNDSNNKNKKLEYYEYTLNNKENQSKIELSNNLSGRKKYSEDYLVENIVNKKFNEFSSPDRNGL